MKTDLWPTTGVQFTSDEHAAILAGLVAKSAAGVPRAGVLPRNTSTLVTARPDMRVNILPMELVHVKEGARFAALTETLDVVVPSPPSANTQYNIVCYVGSDQKLTGVASTSDFVVVSGTPSATPSDPALPDAAVPIARVAVPSTATATNSAGVVITPLHPFTAAAGGVVLFRSRSEMNAWTPCRGQQGRLVGSSGVWEFDGALWYPTFAVAAEYATQEPVLANGVATPLSTTPGLAVVDSSPFADELLTPKVGGFTVNIAGLYRVEGRVRATVGGAIQPLNHRAFTDVVVGGRLRRLNSFGAPAEDDVTTPSAEFRISAGATLSLSNYQLSGGPRTWSVTWTITYLGPLA